MQGKKFVIKLLLFLHILMKKKKATKEFGKIPGFNELRLINEHSSVAIAYVLNNDTKNILVFDLG